MSDSKNTKPLTLFRQSMRWPILILRLVLLVIKIVEKPLTDSTSALEPSTPYLGGARPSVAIWSNR